MIVLLPEGRAVCNPDSIKMVKVVHSEVQGKRTFVVIVKLDDDAELMIKTLNSVEEAYALADKCSDLINTSEDGDDFSEEDEDEEEDDDSFNIGLSASVEQSVKGTPSAIESDWDSESALTPAAPSPGADSKAQPEAQLESSDWDISSEEDEESSEWLFTSEEEDPQASQVDAEESDWDMSSEQVASSPPAKSASSGASDGVPSKKTDGGTTSKSPVQEEAVEEEESSNWSLSVEAAVEDDESSDWFSDEGFSAPVRSPVAKERAMKKKPKPVEPKLPVVEVRRPKEPVIREDSLDDSDDWFVDDGNDDWY